MAVPTPPARKTSSRRLKTDASAGDQRSRLPAESGFIVGVIANYLLKERSRKPTSIFARSSPMAPPFMNIALFYWNTDRRPDAA